MTSKSTGDEPVAGSNPVRAEIKFNHEYLGRMHEESSKAEMQLASEKQKFEERDKEFEQILDIVNRAQKLRAPSERLVRSREEPPATHQGTLHATSNLLYDAILSISQAGKAWINAQDSIRSAEEEVNQAGFRLHEALTKVQENVKSSRKGQKRGATGTSTEQSGENEKKQKQRRLNAYVEDDPDAE